MPSGQEYVGRLNQKIRGALEARLVELEGAVQRLQDQLESSIECVRRETGQVRELEIPDLSEPLVEALKEESRQEQENRAFLAGFARKLRQQETQEEILSLLLDGAHHFGTQAALFVVRGDRFVGWASRGFSEPASRTIRECSFSQAESRLVRGSLESEQHGFSGDTEDEPALVKVTAGELVWPCHSFPLRATRSAVAVLLVSFKSERAADVHSLYLMLELTGFSIENLALRVLQEISAAPAARMPEPPAPAERPPAASTGEPSPGGRVPEWSTPYSREIPLVQSEDARDAASAVAVDDRRDAPPSAGHQISDGAVISSGGLQSAVAAAAIAGSSLGTAVAESPDVVHAPFGAHEAAPPEEAREAPEEEKLHSDARRFARLLVSEIKLYNEPKVIEGRQNRDVYVRLKRDIDRSREMYEKRVSPLVLHKVDYFHAELIRILGENDPSKLGNDYPGSRAS